MSKNTVNTMKPIACEDDVSVSVYDDNINDMLNMDLYTHGWKLVGTAPPSPVNTEYFNMKFIQPIIDPNGGKEVVDALAEAPITLRHTDDILVELIPIDKRTLKYTYDYFKQFVSTGVKGDLLVNVCKSVYVRGDSSSMNVYKSPVFDILNCTVVLPQRTDFSRQTFTAIDTERGPGILFVPMVITDMIMDNLDNVGIRVMPSPQDMWSYSSCRIRLSTLAVSCDFGPGDWKGSAYTAEFSRRIPSRAVATATLTVSILLEPWQHSRGKHTSKYYMTYVVHAVK